jgi:hypothetical protein
MKKAICGEEREKFTELMQPIADLKPGDKVQWKHGLKESNIPQYDEVVEVFRVKNTPAGPFGTNHACDENDFVILVRGEDDEIQEYAFDSRRFERVE